MPAGTVNVRGDLTVARGALLDAVAPASGGIGAALPGTVNVTGNIRVRPGAVLALGCGPDSCKSPLGSTDDHVGGSITGFGALAVLVHSTTIGGNLSLLGGGGGPTVEGAPATNACLGSTTPPAPWSQDPNLAHIPVYSDLEDNSIGGNMTVYGLQSCYFGALRNVVRGSAVFANNSMGDIDANEDVSNTIERNLACFNNTVPVQFGDSGESGGGTPNLVGGFAFGECGFNVMSPDVDYSTGGPQHISVMLHPHR
ncbi:MAG: hypothetical protein ACRDZ6_03325 [Acidimicrobiales bacterium]